MTFAEDKGYCYGVRELLKLKKKNEKKFFKKIGLVKPNFLSGIEIFLFLKLYILPS